MSAAFNAADVQGNILRGYRKPRVRYLMLEVADRAAARRWLAASAIGRRRRSADHHWRDVGDQAGHLFQHRPDLSRDCARSARRPFRSNTFPTEFVDGMNSRAREARRCRAERARRTGRRRSTTPKRLHLIATIYADEIVADRSRAAAGLPSGTSGLTLLGTREGWNFHGDYRPLRLSRQHLAAAASRKSTTPATMRTVSRWRRSAPCCWVSDQFRRSVVAGSATGAARSQRQLQCVPGAGPGRGGLRDISRYGRDAICWAPACRGVAAGRCGGGHR